MPKHYEMGGRTSSRPAGAQLHGAAGGDRSWRERLGALRNLPPFLKLVWETSPLYTSLTVILRIARALLPVATLFVGKLIIDEVLRLTVIPGAPRSLREWNDSGVAHMAAAVETPSVVVFGSSNTAHWQPWARAAAEFVMEEMD